MTSAPLDRLGRSLFGMTVDEARSLGVCLRCRKDAPRETWATVDVNEWLLSGLCPECFDAILPREDCE
jgi:hypothetical protein